MSLPITNKKGFWWELNYLTWFQAKTVNSAVSAVLENMKDYKWFLLSWRKACHIPIEQLFLPFFSEQFFILMLLQLHIFFLAVRYYILGIFASNGKKTAEVNFARMVGRDLPWVSPAVLPWLDCITDCLKCSCSMNGITMEFKMCRLNLLMVSSKLVHLELAWVSLYCFAICIVVSHPGFISSFLKEICRRGKFNLKVCVYWFLC